MAVIEIESLTKDFEVGFWRKRRVRALDGLTLEIAAGEVFGFLGPNGAGKTTTLKLLMNLIRPTSGRARILGKPLGEVAMRARIGYLPENPYFYDYLTAEELLVYTGKLLGIRQPALGRKVAAMLELVGLAGAGRAQLRKYSKGMVQRIGIAQAILNEPEVVFLDEPMSGLDPLGRREVRDIVTGLRRRGVTVFFSSHILPDVEALCDRVAIMHRGKLREVGSLDAILNVEIEAHEIILGRLPAGLAERLRDVCAELTPLGDRLQVRAHGSRQVEAVVSFAVAQGAELVSVNPIRPSLEDYFLAEVGKG
jgi:ABC-2 type transport system ATP-binding protein